MSVENDKHLTVIHDIAVTLGSEDRSHLAFHLARAETAFRATDIALAHAQANLEHECKGVDAVLKALGQERTEAGTFIRGRAVAAIRDLQSRVAAAERLIRTLRDNACPLVATGGMLKRRLPDSPETRAWDAALATFITESGVPLPIACGGSKPEPAHHCHNSRGGVLCEVCGGDLDWCVAGHPTRRGEKCNCGEPAQTIPERERTPSATTFVDSVMSRLERLVVGDEPTLVNAAARVSQAWAVGSFEEQRQAVVALDRVLATFFKGGPK